MSTEIALPPALNMERLIELALATCASKETRRMYTSQLRKFIKTGLPLNREGVALHIQRERDAGKGGSTLLSATAAIRKLAQEAMIRGLMSRDELEQIKSISVGKIYKPNVGVWLTVPQVEALLALPNRATYFGKRDACILSIMLGCGLRRTEMSSVKWEAYHSRDGRMCLHVLGKGNKTRTLPVPVWAQPDIEAWYQLSQARNPPPPKHFGTRNLTSFTRGFNKELIAGGLSGEGIHDIINGYGDKLGVALSPHDLRRTLAQLLRKAGALLEQIQYTLGHEDITTTVLYLGSKLELAPGVAAVDQLQIYSGQIRSADMDRLTMALEADREESEEE